MFAGDQFTRSEVDYYWLYNIYIYIIFNNIYIYIRALGRPPSPQPAATLTHEH